MGPSVQGQGARPMARSGLPLTLVWPSEQGTSEQRDGHQYPERGEAYGPADAQEEHCGFGGRVDLAEGTKARDEADDGPEQSACGGGISGHHQMASHSIPMFVAHWVTRQR